MTNLEQAILDMEYLSCDVDQHGQELSLVCLQKRCHRTLLICPICEIEKHQGHDVLPLRTYLAQTYRNQREAEQIVLENIQKVEEMRESVKVQLHDLKESFLDSLYTVENRSVEYFNKLVQKMMEINEVNSAKYVTKTLKSISDTQSLPKCRKLISDIRLYGQGSIEDVLHHYTTSSEAKIKDFKSVVQSIDLNSKLTKMGTIFGAVKDYALKLSYYWSHLKADKIQINGMIASQTSSSSGGQRFALVDSKEKIFSDIEIGFKIKKLKGWIGIGICLQKVIVNAGYKFNYTQTFHGSYLISSNGYSWSHSQPQFNSVQNAYNFVEGDTVKITLNLTKKEVTFLNTKKQHGITLEVVEPQAGDFYVPCVNMCNPGDEVQIINDLD